MQKYFEFSCVALATKAMRNSTTHGPLPFLNTSILSWPLDIYLVFAFLLHKVIRQSDTSCPQPICGDVIIGCSWRQVHEPLHFFKIYMTSVNEEFSLLLHTDRGSGSVTRSVHVFHTKLAARHNGI